MRLYRGRSLSSSTIRRILLGAGLRSSWTVKKPVLTAAQKEKRLRYTLDNRTGGWSLVFFCDETSFYGCTRKHRVRRTAQEEFVPMPTVKHHPKINAWADISSRGNGKLILFKENLDVALHKRIITDYMVPSLRALNGGRCNRLVVQQDNNPKLTSLACSSRPRVPTSTHWRMFGRS